MRMPKCLLLFIFLIPLLLTSGIAGTEAASKRLSVSSKKLWLNGEGSIIVTLNNHEDSDELKFKVSKSHAAKIECGEWIGDCCEIIITPLKDTNVTLTITAGGEKVSVRLYMLTEQERTAEYLYAYASPAMVEIRTWDSNSTLYIGSGFFVGSGLILTNAHVIEAASKIEISDYSGNILKISSIYNYDEVRDLALIKVSAKNTAALAIADSVTGGERVYNIGSPVGMTGTFTTGIVSNPYRIIDNLPCIQTSLPSGIGSGGGPVLNSKGQVLGVMTYTVTSAQNMCLCTDTGIVKEFLYNTSDSTHMSLKALYKANKGKRKDSNYTGIITSSEAYTKLSNNTEGKKELDAVEMYALGYDAMVDIVVVFTDGVEINRASGSGFFINENTIVTNAHVAINGIERVYGVYDYYDRQYEVVGDVIYDEDLDIAVMTVTCEEGLDKHGILSVAIDYIPRVGELVYSYGSPLGYNATMADGIVTMSTMMIDDVQCINFMAPISNGSSGGVLLNKYGEVIGITSMKITVTENSNLAILIGYLRELGISELWKEAV